MQGETKGSGRHTGFECAVNPKTARRPIKSPDTGSKKILVVGGGVAGITAALTAEEIGHYVTLVEKSDSLGGLIRFTYTDTVKIDLKRFLEYLLKRVDSSNVRVSLNTDATPDLVKAESPDAVLVAIGSTPVVPKIPGIEMAMHATEVYRYPEKIGQKVIMIGGGLTGCETSLHLANLEKDVTIVELMDAIAADTNPQHSGGLMDSISEKKIGCLTGLKCTEISNSGIKVTDKEGAEGFFEADTVIYAVGMRPVTDVAERLSGLAPFVIPIGDCARIGKVMDAVYDGFFSARNLFL